MPLLSSAWARARRASSSRCFSCTCAAGQTREDALPHYSSLFLTKLLVEAYFFLHRGHLTASLMNRRLCLLPFHRKVKLTINDVLRMYQGLLRCERNGGAVFFTSEHRL